jgi:hypothetical protein
MVVGAAQLQAVKEVPQVGVWQVGQAVGQYGQLAE